MRLICPNCDAQYEVDARAIPAEGRDVQCSDCGNAWFATTTPLMPSTDDDAFERELTRALGDDGDTGRANRAPAPHLNENIVGVLQEEAERELDARRSAAPEPQVDTQPEMPQYEPKNPESEPESDPSYNAVMAKRRAELSARVAHLRGQDETYATNGASNGDGQDLKGRNVLPDVDEISSTLDTPRNSQNAQLIDNGIVVSNARSSFRKGFTSVVTISAIIFALYAFAPRIAEMVPQLKPMLEAFTNVVNEFRSFVADYMTMGVEKIKLMLAERNA